jgi:hypothetical protein
MGMILGRLQRNGNGPTKNGQPGESWNQAFSLFGMRPASRPRYLHATQTDMLDNDNAADENFLPPLWPPILYPLRCAGTSACPFGHQDVLLDAFTLHGPGGSETAPPW